MSSMDPTSESVPPSPLDAPHWQVSLVDLFSAITLVAVLLGLTHWFGRDFGTARTYDTSVRVALPAGVTLIVYALSYWYARRRGGPLLYHLRLRTSLARWKVLMWIPFAAGIAIYSAGLLMGQGQSMAPMAITLMWVFGTSSALHLLFGSLRLQEAGIVRAPGLIWVLTPWQQCRLLKFELDKNGDLVVGHSWSRVVATVRPGQHAIVAGLLNRKLGLTETPPADESKSRGGAK